MIELDIKIKAKDAETVKLFTQMMIDGLDLANKLGEIDVELSAEKDGDTITLVRKEIIKEKIITRTPIDVFLEKSNLPIRIKNVLDGTIGYKYERRFNPNAKKEPPFKFAEDITKTVFLKLRNVGNNSWLRLEEELYLQKIHY